MEWVGGRFSERSDVTLQRNPEQDEKCSLIFFFNLVRKDFLPVLYLSNLHVYIYAEIC